MAQTKSKPKAKSKAKSSRSKSNERTIKHKAFTYRVEGESPVEPGKKLYVERIARRGDTVELREEDIARGEAHGAFADPEVAEAVEGGVSLVDATDTELAEFVKNAKPGEVVDASEGNAELASRLLAAENLATGNDPREGVVSGLEAVAAGANE